MSEFKGTPGKWEITEDKGKILIETFGINNWTIFETVTKESQDKANAKLIVHAPELLEMVKLLVDRLEENGLGKLYAISRAKELIKSATE